MSLFTWSSLIRCSVQVERSQNVWNVLAGLGGVNCGEDCDKEKLQRDWADHPAGGLLPITVLVMIAGQCHLPHHNHHQHSRNCLLRPTIQTLSLDSFQKTFQLKLQCEGWGLFFMISIINWLAPQSQTDTPEHDPSQCQCPWSGDLVVFLARSWQPWHKINEPPNNGIRNPSRLYPAR